jgi:hypothetical protein
LAQHEAEQTSTLSIPQSHALSPLHEELVHVRLGRRQLVGRLKAPEGANII